MCGAGRVMLAHSGCKEAESHRPLQAVHRSGTVLSQGSLLDALRQAAEVSQCPSHGLSLHFHSSSPRLTL